MIDLQQLRMSTEGVVFTDPERITSPGDGRTTIGFSLYWVHFVSFDEGNIHQIALSPQGYAFFYLAMHHADATCDQFMRHHQPLAGWDALTVRVVGLLHSGD